MRKISVVLAAAATVLSTPVLAADFAARPTFVRPAAPDVVNWSGFYVGGHLGYGTARGKLSDPTPPSQNYTDKLKGFIGGGQIGYNFQRGSWVYGVEADFSGSDVHGGTTLFDPVANNTDQTKQRLRWTSLLTARIGHTFDRSLIYVKGGAAFGGARLEVNDLTAGVSSGSNFTKAGWTVGGGVEYALTRSWSVRGEYDYIALGTKSLTFTDSTGATQPIDVKLNSHQFKAGLNYRF